MKSNDNNENIKKRDEQIGKLITLLTNDAFEINEFIAVSMEYIGNPYRVVSYAELMKKIVKKNTVKYSLEEIYQELEKADVVTLKGIFLLEGLGVPKDSKAAFECLKNEALKDDKIAQYQLAVCYSNGLGVTKDFGQAAFWCTKAAAQGYADAQGSLGFFYDNGYGVEKDYKKAAEWYGKAADQGHAPAQNNLGLYYENGQGVEQNYEQSVKWYRKAAEHGYADAQYNLGVCYEIGQKEVDQDYKQAAEWYKKAADQDDKHAQEALNRVEKLTKSWRYKLCGTNGQKAALGGVALGIAGGGAATALIFTTEMFALALIATNPALLMLCAVALVLTASLATYSYQCKIANQVEQKSPTGQAL